MIITCIIIFGVALILVLFSTQKLLQLSGNLHRCNEMADERKIPGVKKPDLGGVTIFASLMLTCFLFLPAGSIHELKFIITGVFVLFMMGLADDLTGISPVVKFGGQLVVSTMATLFGGFRFTSFYGFLNIYEIPFIASMIISIFFIILLVNSFNFMSGFNRLAGSLSLLLCLAFAGLFWKMGQTVFLYLAIGLCGCLTGFVFYNRAPVKIIMGNNGSMFTGFFIAVFAIRFVEMNKLTTANLPGSPMMAAPALLLGLLVIPVFDTLRCLFVRILNRKSSFYPYRNHIHYRLRAVGLSDLQSTCILLLVNALSLCGMYFLRHLGMNMLLLILTVFILSLNWTLSFISSQKVNKTQQAKKSYLSPQLSKSLDFAKSVNE
jgi:UDP-GlcNAc:undecaprenyl-phosphate/decaprenyl-phosphate GlcNAc-1-phosphate transferase